MAAAQQQCFAQLCLEQNCAREPNDASLFLRQSFKRLGVSDGNNSDIPVAQPMQDQQPVALAFSLVPF
ncbi:MAG: hypothetical protein NT138_04865 [Planctomycetales bacterium]|nr:hypothetical protein [Planctomycetales bacterium]